MKRLYNEKTKEDENNNNSFSFFSNSLSHYPFPTLKALLDALNITHKVAYQTKDDKEINKLKQMMYRLEQDARAKHDKISDINQKVHEIEEELTRQHRHISTKCRSLETRGNVYGVGEFVTALSQLGTSTGAALAIGEGVAGAAFLGSTPIGWTTGSLLFAAGMFSGSARESFKGRKADTGKHTQYEIDSLCNVAKQNMLALSQTPNLEEWKDDISALRQHFTFPLKRIMVEAIELYESIVKLDLSFYVTVLDNAKQLLSQFIELDKDVEKRLQDTGYLQTGATVASKMAKIPTQLAKTCFGKELNDIANESKEEKKTDKVQSDNDDSDDDADEPESQAKRARLR